jgi:hypothetical protein
MHLFPLTTLQKKVANTLPVSVTPYIYNLITMEAEKYYIHPFQQKETEAFILPAV